MAPTTHRGGDLMLDPYTLGPHPVHRPEWLGWMHRIAAPLTRHNERHTLPLWCMDMGRVWWLVVHNERIRRLRDDEIKAADRAIGWDRPSPSEQRAIVQAVIADLGLLPDFNAPSTADNAAHCSASDSVGGRVLPLRRSVG